MKNVIQLLYFIGLWQTASAQNFLVGNVISSDDKKPIPFAAVYFKNAQISTYTDESGFFKLTITNSLHADSLIIQYVGYKKLAFALDEIKTKNITDFMLVPDTMKLREVKVNLKPLSKGALRSAGKVKKTNGGIYKSFADYNQEVAIFIDLQEYSGKLIKLKKIKYYIYNDGKYKAPFGIKLYDKDTHNLPGKDLLHKRVIIQAKRKNAWAVADLDSLNIFLPATGVFAAMEWIPIYSEYKYEESKWGGFRENGYGQVLGLTTTDIKNNHYYIKDKNALWWRLEQKKIIANPMIYIEVEIFD